MGASGWYYFVPFQEDVSQALQTLRQEVFATGKYYKLSELSDEDFPSEEPPTTIEELLERTEPDGTHSILDITGIGSDQSFGIITRLDDDELLEEFGTTRPDHEQVETVVEEGWDSGMYHERWEGIYFLVYKNNVPDEIFFMGYSGD